MAGFTRLADDLFLWSDTCNVYVLRDGAAALLVDLGDGSVLDQLSELGVKSVDWVLFTHHHREQCQGAPKLAPWRKRGTRTACSTLEKPFFETPASFRKMRPTLNDAFTVYGASYVRPPVEPIAMDRTFAKMDDFTWRGREFWVVETQGNAPGHTAYLLRGPAGRWWAFTGDLMVDGSRMHNWFDTEWDYGFAKGLFELGKSAAQIAGYDPALLLPSHGPIVRDARTQLESYVRRLRALADLYVRGYDIQRFDNCDQDNVSQPTVVPHLWQLSPHLYKFRGPNYWVNFAMIRADNGHALLVDCGLFDLQFLDQALTRAHERLGVTKIDAIFVTHMHGDHALDAEHVRQKWGAQLWTMAGVADKFERPWDWDLAALLPAYTDRGKNPGPLKFDRVLNEGDLLEWEGYTFACDWMPGQTKYHACLHGEIDGQQVAFTGDNLFASTTDPRQGGNEAVVARNGGALEEGYLYAASYLHGIGPDLLVGGHCWAMAKPTALIERYRKRATELRAAFQELLGPEDYRYGFDPYWVQALPYRVLVPPGGKTEFLARVRNFGENSEFHEVQLRCPPGLRTDPAVLTGSTPGGSYAVYRVQLHATADAPRGVQLVAFDITRDGRRHGELFDFIAHVGEFAEPPTAADGKSGY